MVPPDAPAPITILRQGCYLVVSVDAVLDDTQMEQFRAELSTAIDDRRTRGVLIDVAALDVLDSFGAQNIRDIAAMARLRGATTVIVGVEPNVAFSMVQLGIDAGAIPTALDLEDGLDVVADIGESMRPRGTPGVFRRHDGE